MSFNDSQEEFSILLEMGQEDYNGGYLSPTVKLFNMWAKRTPLADRLKIFKNVSLQSWKKLGYPANFWAFEQKMLFPDSVNCPVENLWPLNAYPPDDNPYMVAQRLKCLLEKNAPARTAVEFISEIHTNSNNWSCALKDPHALSKLKEVIDQASQKSPAFANAILSAFPSPLNKKLTQGHTALSTSQAAVERFVSVIKKSKPTQSEVAALSQVTPASILPNHEVMIKIRAHFAENSLAYFKTTTNILLQGKWQNKDIIHLSPRLSCYTTTQVLRNFLPFWLSHKPTQKMVQEVYNQRIGLILIGPVQFLERTIKWFKDLKNAGVTQEDFSQWSGSQLQLDAWGGLYDILKYPNKLSSLIEKNAETIADVLPNHVIGTLMVFKHLADKKALDTRFPSLKFAALEEMQKQIPHNYDFSEKDQEKLETLAAEFKSNVDKLNITRSFSSLPSASPAKQRKM